MSKTHASLSSAVVSVIQRKEPAPLADATLDNILYQFQRELKSAEVEDIGRLYFYEPQSVAERDAYQKHMRYDDKGVSISMLGIVDGIIARVRNKDGRPLFSTGERDRLLNLPAERVMAIWHGIGGSSASPADIETAEKK